MEWIKEVMSNSVTTFFLGTVAGYFLNKLLDLIGEKLKDILNTLRSRQSKQYERTIQSKEYIDFQKIVLKDYYGDAFFTKVFGKEYPVFCIKGNIEYPFEKLCDREFSVDKKIPFEQGKYYKNYKDVVEKNIHRPKMQGFMIDKFILNCDEKIIGMDTWVGTYEQNVYTSHILEYELYREYLIYKKTGNYNIERLRLRNSIHRDTEEKKEALISGCNRASLLGVQLLVIFKDKKTSRYQVLAIKRSEDVAAKPGFYQFVPSGGFEVFENSDEHDIHELKQNYNVLWAIYREYIEELILGKENDYEYGKGGETISKIEKEESVKKIVELIDKKEAFFEFLGSVVDLCGLRHELSFVLRIDNSEYSESIFKSNSESKKINRYFIDEIEKQLDVEKLNPPSAALWNLFKHSNLFNGIQ